MTSSDYDDRADFAENCAENLAEDCAENCAQFLAWADGAGGAWRNECGLWLRERCDFTGDSFICVTLPTRSGGCADRRAHARVATPAERRQFLRSLPTWSGIVIGQTGNGLPIALGTGARGAAPAELTRVIRDGRNAALFERVHARVGIEMFAEEIIGSEVAQELRSCWRRGVDLPRRLRGASPLHRHAFRYACEMGTAHVSRSLLGRIETALASGGARLIDWRALPEREIVVAWSPQSGVLSGQRIETRACGDSLAVKAAGICVAGADAAFDLASLASAVTRQTDHLSGDQHGRDFAFGNALVGNPSAAVAQLR